MSVCERCRAAGEKLYLKGEKCFTPKCPFTRRPYPPGQTGERKARPARRSDRMGDFARQLQAKQKLKSTYNIRERQLRRFFRVASKQSGQRGELLLRLLELRLDNVVFRAKLASSRGAARQAISHGRVMVNGRSVTTKSYITRIADVVSLERLATAEEWGPKDLPPWLEAAAKQSVRIVRFPSREELPPELDERAVVEYLSR